MKRIYLATLALGLTLVAAPTKPALAAKAKAQAKPGQSWLSRYAATRTARGEFNRLIKREDLLNRQYAANKSVQTGYGTGLATGAGVGFAGIGLAMGDAFLRPPEPSVVAAVEVTGVMGMFASVLFARASTLRDQARGETVRFALANGFKVDRSLISAMKQSGRFGAFDAKTIAAYKLQPKPKKRKA
jgi:hypothetical protein